MDSSGLSSLMRIYVPAEEQQDEDDKCSCCTKLEI